MTNNHSVNSTWTQDKEWAGNPTLQLLSYTKLFRNPHRNNRLTPVTVFGKAEKWDFCVDDGPNGDFSYTGFCVDCKTPEEAMSYVDKYGKLFH